MFKIGDTVVYIGDNDRELTKYNKYKITHCFYDDTLGFDEAYWTYKSSDFIFLDKFLLEERLNKILKIKENINENR